MLKIIGAMMCVAGGLLLLAAILGQLGVVETGQAATPRDWERFDPEMAASTRSLEALQQVARQEIPQNAGARHAMDVLFSVVVDRFTHQEARHTFFGNWVLFMLGQLDPAFAHIWGPDQMARHSESLFCDQSSYLLLSLALSRGIRARHVGLDGHVVMEAWYDDGWHMYDPDLEVVPVGDDGRVLSVEALAMQPARLEKYYGRHGVTEIIASRENNTYMSYPPGARFEWKANMLARFEQWMEAGKFIIPVLLVLMGGWLAGRRRC